MGRLFGTGGVRGVVNEDLTADLTVRLGKAIGSFFKGTVVIASDTRDSGGMLKSAVSSGLMSAGADVIDIGITPAPSMQYYAGTHDVSGGVMISSYGHPRFNGIRCVDKAGRELTKEDEDRIEALISEGTECVGENYAGTMTYDGSAADAYADAVAGQVDADAIRNADLTVVLDCANGASFGSSPLILSKLGVRAMTINASPHMGPADRPGGLTEDGLKDTLAVMRSVKADLGIVHDGDAGGVAFITDDGIFAGADRIMALMAKYMLSKGKGTVVTPVSSSSIIGDVVKAEGGTLFCTALAPSAVAKAMTASKAVFGGEGNGGLIFPKHQLCRDGAMAAAMMLECVAKNGPLSKQIKDIPSYHIERRKIDCPDELKADLLKHLGELNRDIRTDATDGIKMLYDDGWVLARPSGTEPKFRICSESKDKKIAIQRANETEIKAIEFVESLLTKDKV